MTMIFRSSTAPKMVEVDYDNKVYSYVCYNDINYLSEDIIFVSSNKELNKIEKGLLKNGFLEEKKESNNNLRRSDC